MSTQQFLPLDIPDVPTLLTVYMPFLERGGLFVATLQRYALGDAVVLLVTLPGEHEELVIHGDVVWVSPEGVSGRRVPGVGVHFNRQDYNVRDRVETLLAGQLDTAEPSLTL
ncbi:MAG: PilZ domain-containing protein [Halomonas subglaciescola]|nr:PilZ domain-containing protein [Halomonas subglaciescola]